ncbi:MAG TPA: MG2 domain-containing protein [Thermotogota bacterium]|nr:MG2 domain-containing protein [Thermotogota bacterium]HRW92338.1 MG2 domain-containing protein [Thermotogota bacterium]
MKRTIAIFALAILLAGILLAEGLSVYGPSFRVLNPNQDLEFSVWSDSKELKLSLYRLEDAIETYQQITENNRVPHQKGNFITSYLVDISRNYYQGLKIPSSLFFENGGFLLEIATTGIDSEKRVVRYMVIERTQADGIAIRRGEEILVQLWDTLTGEAIRFRNVKTGKQLVPLSVAGESSPLVSIPAEKIQDNFLLFSTPRGNAFVAIDSYRENPQGVEFLFLTDRPMYRPGDEIGMRGYFFDLRAGRLLSAGSADITVTDPLGRKILDQTQALDEWGGFSLLLATTDESVRGHYSVEVTLDGENHYRYFEIADYTKPPFTVTTSGLKKTIGLGEEASMEVLARYYYGQNLSEGTAFFHLSQLSPYQDPLEKTISRVLQDGKAGVTLQLPYDRPRSFALETTVVDAAGREVEAVDYFEVIPSDVRMRFTESPRYWNSAANPVDFTLGMEPLFEPSESYAGPGFPRLVDIVIQGPKDHDATTTRSTDENGILEYAFDPPVPGYYNIRFIDRKHPENWIERRLFFYSAQYAYDTEEELSFITNQPEYSPGDLAQIQVLSSYQNLNILAVADFGDRAILRSFSLSANRHTLELEIPRSIQCQQVRLQVFSFIGGKRISESLDLPINLDHVSAHIQMEHPDEILPGQVTPLSLELRDHEDTPLDGFLTLSILDQAVLDLYGADDWQTLLDPLSNPPLNYTVYYFNTRYVVENALAYGFSEEGEEPLFAYDSPETLAQTKMAAPVLKVRSNFSDTAYWKPLLLVPGSTTLEVPFPEDLTTWAIRATGFTAEGKRGYAKSSIITTQPVTLNPVFPQFLMSGDVVRLGVQLGNNNDNPAQYQVSMHYRGKQTTQTISLAPRQSTHVWFEQSIPEVDEATETSFTFEAISEVGGDALKWSVPLLPRTFVRPTSLAGMLLQNPDRFEFTAQAPTTFSFTLSTDLYAELFEAIAYLVQYPWGCTEQTVSSFLPAIAFQQLINQTPSLAQHFEGEEVWQILPDVLQKGLERLYRSQLYSGGWGWWSSSSSGSSAFMTAYVLYAFHELQRAGIAVFEESLQRGIRSLETLLQSTEDEDSDYPYLPFCYYVLSLFSPDSLLFSTAEEGAYYDLFNGLVLVQKGLKDAARKQLQSLLKNFRTLDTLGWIAFQSPGYFLGDLQLNALLLQLMNQLEYEGSEKDALVRYLFQKRNGKYWYSTKDTAFVVMALLNIVPQSGKFSLKLGGNLPSFFTELENQIEMAEGQTFDFQGELQPGEFVSGILEGTPGLLWRFVAKETWPAESYQTPPSTETLTRSFQKIFSIPVVWVDKGGKESRKVQEEYLSLDQPLVPSMLLHMENGSGNLSEHQPADAVAVQSMLLHKESRNQNELWINGSFVGLTFSDSVKIMGFSEKAIIITPNPWTGQEGNWYLFFRKNPRELHVGDEVRTLLTVHLENPWPYTCLVENIAPTMGESEGISRHYVYRGKFLDFTWSSYPIHVERRYDRVTNFEDRISRGKSIYVNYYRLTTAGSFLIPPALLFPMYEEQTTLTTNAIPLTVLP